MKQLRQICRLAASLMLSSMFISAAYGSHTAAVVTGVDGQKSIQLKHAKLGLLAGPCIAPYPGMVKETYWIRLDGDGPTFSVGQLRFVNAKGDSVAAGKMLSGEIRLDKVKHLLIVDLHENGEPMPYNGKYRYKGEI